MSVVVLEVMSESGCLRVNVSFHHFALKICQLAEAFLGGGGGAIHGKVNKESEISTRMWHHARMLFQFVCEASGQK